jgi:hypothetical protein
LEVGCSGACVPVIPAFRRLRQDDGEFEAILDYIVMSCLKKRNKQNDLETKVYWVSPFKVILEVPHDYVSLYPAFGVSDQEEEISNSIIGPLRPRRGFSRSGSYFCFPLVCDN